MFKFLVLMSFFLAYTTTFVHAIDPEVVTDVNGNELRSGALYFMEVPFASEIPSAVGPNNPSCPQGYVVLDLSKRRPISITPVKSNSTVILEDTYVTVRFNYLFPCKAAISLVWAVDWRDGRVVTGGIERVHRFKLSKYEGEGGSNKYQLAACPVSECWALCRCKRVGYVVKDGVSYLVVGGDPLTFVFVPVEEPRITYKLPSM